MIEPIIKVTNVALPSDILLKVNANVMPIAYRAFNVDKRKFEPDVEFQYQSMMAYGALLQDMKHHNLELTNKRFIYMTPAHPEDQNARPFSDTYYWILMEIMP